MHVARVLLCFFLCFCLLSCSSTLDVPTLVPQTFVLTTAESLHSLALELTDAYHRTHASITFDLREGNAAVALDEFTRGDAPQRLAFVTARPSDDELARVPNGAQALELGRDGIAVVVNPANSLQNLTHDQVTKIFAGELREWSNVGAKLPVGASPVIAVVSRESGSGTRAVFEQILMNGRRVTLTAAIQPSERDVVDYVAAQPDSIGYLSLNALSPRVHAVSIDGVSPTLDNIASGKYIPARSVFLLTPSQPSADLYAFIAYLQSSDARRILERYLVVK